MESMNVTAMIALLNGVMGAGIIYCLVRQPKSAKSSLALVRFRKKALVGLHRETLFHQNVYKRKQSSVKFGVVRLSITEMGFQTILWLSQRQ